MLCDAAKKKLKVKIMLYIFRMFLLGFRTGIYYEVLFSLIVLP